LVGTQAAVFFTGLFTAHAIHRSEVLRLAAQTFNQLAKLVFMLVMNTPRRPLLLFCSTLFFVMMQLAAAVHAQPATTSSPATPHDPQTSMLPDAKGAVPWSLLSATPIRMINGKLGPAFSPALAPFNGQTVKLQGYILPLEAGQTHRYFLLSAWSPTCPFCLTAGPEAMVEVRAKAAVRYSMDPVVVEGRLMLLDSDPGGMFYRLVDATPAILR
jgi:uncharacterized protein